MTPTPPISTRAEEPQQPSWPDPETLSEAELELSTLPPLTSEEEVVALARRLAAVAGGDALLLQAGDCAERFFDAAPEITRRKVSHLRQLAGQIRTASGLQVVTIGRMAGQYGKPRSAAFEPGVSDPPIHTYRGDAVNAIQPVPNLRMPNPRRLVDAYWSSKAVLDELRISWPRCPPAERVFASHELLLLPYEEPLVRTGRYGLYNGSTHFGWIGARTRDYTGPHIALARDLHNPVGVKIGPSTLPDEAVQLSRTLNPDSVPGRLTFITRFGAPKIERSLPPIVEAVARHGTSVIWICDPMHGNTCSLGGHKTRTMEAMMSEVRSFVRILSRRGLLPGGLHLELTPDPVTECLDVASDVTELTDYRSACDPRLGPDQSVRLIDHFLAHC